MILLLCLCWSIVLAPISLAVGHDALPVASLDVRPERLVLEGPFAYRQLLITAELADGGRVDVTRQAQLHLENTLVDIDERGLVTPRSNGTGVLEFLVQGHLTQIPCEVRGLGQEPTVSFQRDVMPVLSRAGCNAGTCHGSANGKNGFKLSLRGYDASADHQALVDDLSGRRFNRVEPERSLMLQKPLARVPHEGGAILQPKSREYELLLSWIESGTPIDKAQRPSRLELLPQEISISMPGEEQQVAVLAHYPDGLVRDVTREAFVESSDADVVRADNRALITAVRRGEASILVRYEGAYAASPIFVMGDRSGWEWHQQPRYNYIDELVDRKLQSIRSEASPLCSDEEFLRRVYLDLTGLAPTPKAIRAFLLDARNTQLKRDEQIERLLGSAEFVEHWTNKWADLLQVNAKFLGSEGGQRFHEWIRTKIASNEPYDQFVAAILSASGSTYENPAAAYYKILRKPDLVMENTTQLFMGVRFNCNKCHDHPFERWTRAQHWHLASFFAQVERHNAPNAALMPLVGDNRPEEALAFEEIISDQGTTDVEDPDTGIAYGAIFPFEHAGAIPTEASRRERLVSWLTAPENPYFATSYVNRVWSYFLGVGLIEPVDDIRAGNPPSNPQLLERLTADFVQHDFDVRHLMRTICRSRTYQLSIQPTVWNRDDQVSFSHARARRLSAEALYDVLCQATGSVSKLPGMMPGERAAAAADPSTRLEDGFLDLFGRPPRESACECERTSGMSLGQALHLVNGPTVADAVRDPNNRFADLVRVASTPEKIVEELYLSFLARFPTAEEQAVLRPSFDLGLAANRYALDPTALTRWEAEFAAMQAALHAPAWHPAEWVSTGSALGSSTEKLGDGSLLVHATNIEKDTLTLVLWSDLEAIRGLRLDVLADANLPNNGPGLAENGNFVLSEVQIAAVPYDNPAQARVVKIAHATSDFAQQGFPVADAIDGRQETGWAIVPALGQRHSAIFEFADDVGSAAGTALVVTLQQQYGGRHLLGRMRFSVTASERPIRHTGLPELVELALLKPAALRTSEEETALWRHFVSSQPELAQELRLGATQDLAWALANSPAFLFNR